nr:ABC transporter substrate-binding (seleno)protein SaoB [Terrisporobacter sp.]
MAIICKEAAESFIKYDNNFEVVAPLVKNSDVFILNNDTPKTIGITQNREYQKELVEKYYGKSKYVSLIGSALMYTLENNTVEGVVIDAIKALSSDKNKLSTTSKGEYDTYVLVVNKKFMKSDLYHEFTKLYNSSVIELEDEKILKKALEEYIDRLITDKEMEEIKGWKLKFLQIK